MIYILLFLFIFILLPAAYAGISTAPFAPVNEKDVDEVLKLANLKPNEKFYELGCGDGRVILKAVQKYQVKAVGIEIQPVLILVSKIKAFLKGIDKKKLGIRWGNFMKEDLRGADVVFFYLLPKAMPNLRQKLKKELKKGTRVISYTFPVSGWKEERIIRSPHTKFPIYLYQI